MNMKKYAQIKGNIERECQNCGKITNLICFFDKKRDFKMLCPDCFSKGYEDKNNIEVKRFF